jgi:hypothetical protein
VLRIRAEVSRTTFDATEQSGSFGEIKARRELRVAEEILFNRFAGEVRLRSAGGFRQMLQSASERFGKS